MVFRLRDVNGHCCSGNTLKVQICFSTVYACGHFTTVCLLWFSITVFKHVKFWLLLFTVCIHYVHRDAAGRLMRLEDTQTQLDDFGIPLQITSSSDSKEKPPATNVRQNLSPLHRILIPYSGKYSREKILRFESYP